MRALAALLACLALAACASPHIQPLLTPPVGFAGPALQETGFVAGDGARLPMRTWRPEAEPWAVIVALHGMNDHNASFALAGPAWAERGITTYAYDQRGFGQAPGRGEWAGEGRMVQDLRDLCALLRARYPHAVLAVVGESMGGSVAMAAFASDTPPEADRLVLLSPGVWGWSSQPLANSVALWTMARLMGATALEPPQLLVKDIRASSNLPELYRMGRDPDQIFATRVDTLYGLIALMEDASRGAARLQVPTAYLYGATDQIIPLHAARAAVGRLPSQARTAFYPEGRHLLNRDWQGQAVYADVDAFLRDPTAPWPSGASPFPGHAR